MSRMPDVPAGVADTPLTSMPAPADLLSDETLKLYEQFSDLNKERYRSQLAMNILKGEFFAQHDYSSFDMSPDLFVFGLREWSDDWVRDWACYVEHLGCGESRSTTQLQSR